MKKSSLLAVGFSFFSLQSLACPLFYKVDMRNTHIVAYDLEGKKVDEAQYDEHGELNLPQVTQHCNDNICTNYIVSKESTYNEHDKVSVRKIFSSLESTPEIKKLMGTFTFQYDSEGKLLSIKGVHSTLGLATEVNVNWFTKKIHIVKHGNVFDEYESQEHLGAKRTYDIQYLEMPSSRFFEYSMSGLPDFNEEDLLKYPVVTYKKSCTPLQTPKVDYICDKNYDFYEISFLCDAQNSVLNCHGESKKDHGETSVKTYDIQFKKAFDLYYPAKSVTADNYKYPDGSGSINIHRDESDFDSVSGVCTGKNISTSHFYFYSADANTHSYDSSIDENVLTINPSNFRFIQSKGQGKYDRIPLEDLEKKPFTDSITIIAE